MKIIGLTGGIACGKSTVAMMLNQDFGYPVIDADIIAREIVAPGLPAYNEIVKAFGPVILEEDGGFIDRRALGAIVFEDKDKRAILNSITHKYVWREIAKQLVIQQLKCAPICVVDVPLLFETAKSAKSKSKWLTLHGYLSKTIVVSVDEGTQIERLLIRDLHLTRAEAISRIRAQMPLSEKRELADYVVDNMGTRDETRDALEVICDELNSGADPAVVFLVKLLVVVCVMLGVLYVYSRR